MPGPGLLPATPSLDKAIPFAALKRRDQGTFVQMVSRHQGSLLSR